ncbi:MAG: Rrf2 family transcriptional regulator [Candidatus Shapirobacteria bacterium]
MLTIKRQTEYAVFLIHYLHCQNKEVSLKLVSEATSLSLPLLGKVASRLVEADILASKEGKGGGYRLKKPLKKITLKEIMDIFETKRRIVSCFADEQSCIADCRLKSFWHKVEKDLEKRLGRIRLSKML